ncbi:MAG: FAD-dependent oxidoreductase [Rhodospirillales bacterium]|nr:FAD-dependent oxidoreductase [Rhodospirillales bacterium]
MRTFTKTPLAFTYDGRRVEGQDGDTVGSALHAAGVRIFSRSLQFHRPRGLFCVNGRCVSCAVRIDGHPHMRACTVRLESGMTVESEGGWPSMSFDVWRALDFFHFLFPPGFQYRFFIKPRWMFRIWERMLRQIAAHAAVPSPAEKHSSAPSYLKETADVVVVGGGAAGLAAASAACRQGLRVTLIDDNTDLGGGARRSPEALEDAAHEALALKTLTLHLDTRCFAYYGDGPVSAFRGNTLIEVTAKAVVIATGAYERPMIFGNNDLPGIFLSTGALRLLHRYGVRPGTHAVVAATTDDGIATAAALLDAGVHVEAVVDARMHGGAPSSQRLHERGIRILAGYRIEHARGLGRIRAVTVAPCDGHQTRAVHTLPCDVLVTCGGFQPANELCFQATSQGNFLMEGAGGWKSLAQGERQLAARDGTPLFVAGNAARIGSLAKARLEGRIAGLAAAAEIAGGGAALADELRRERAALAALAEPDRWEGESA